MSKGQENHDEENAKAEQSDMNSDKDRENIESPQGNSEQETDTDENSKMEDDIEAVQGEAEEDIDEPADLTKEEILELKKKAEERDTYLDQLLRTKAEFMNYQKRVAKEHESTAQFAVQNLILDFLPELDNFERALKLADDSNDFSKFVEGIKLIEEQLFKV